MYYFQERELKRKQARKRNRQIVNVLCALTLFASVVVFFIGWTEKYNWWIFYSIWAFAVSIAFPTSRGLSKEEMEKIQKRNAIRIHKQRDITYYKYSRLTRFLDFTGFIAFIPGVIIVAIGLFTYDVDKQLVGFLPMFFGFFRMMVSPVNRKTWLGAWGPWYW